MWCTKFIKRSLPLTRLFSYTIPKQNSDLFPGILKHIDTPDNNEDTPFDFTPENYEKVYKILKKYPKNQKRSAIIPLLDLAQQQCGGWIPLTAMQKVAFICGVPNINVYEVVTFYSMFNRYWFSANESVFIDFDRKKVGKYHIQVCKTTPCMIRGSDEIEEALKSHLKVKMGGTTKDGLFTLGEVECMGCCTNAPMIVISDYSNPPHHYSYDYYEDLTPEKAIEIVEAIKRGEKPTPGPQNGRKNACGIQGKTTLLKEPRGPYCRDLDAIPDQQATGQEKK